MNILDLFLTSIYLHFCKMKEGGRQVVPWFNACFAIALFVAIAGSMLTKVIAGDSINQTSLPESVFLIVFAIVGVSVFFMIKIYFFDSGKHLILSKEFSEYYPSKRRMLIKTLSIGVLFLIPLLLGVIMWIQII
jgi:hypothetical protein